MHNLFYFTFAYTHLCTFEIDRYKYSTCLPQVKEGKINQACA